MADNKKISELPDATLPLNDADLMEVVQGGVNKKAPKSAVSDGGGTTREFNRTWSAELLFDKNEIAYALQTLSGDLHYTVAAEGHLSNQFSSVIQRVQTDGTRMITFDGFTHVLGDIQSGNIPDAGTYVVMFLYYNGITIANWGKPSAEVSNIIILSTPANMTAAQDGETAIDVDWDNVTNNSGYQIYFSLTGGTGGWTSLAVLAADTVTYKHTGLAAGDQRFYRVRALGDLTTYQNSNFAYADTVITAAGDTDAPVPSFLPANGNSTWTVNDPIVITFDEPIQNTNGTEVTNANAAALVTLKQTNSGGADIAKGVTINSGKNQLTIDPTTHYGANQLVYVAVNNFEDVNGNEETTPQAITFTTTEFTGFDGVSAFVVNDDILDSIITANNTNFWLEITINNFATSGVRRLICKAANDGDGGKTFSSYFSGTSVFFAYYMNGGGYRFIRWTGVLSPGERELVFKYDGSLDTNDGLDRVVLEIGGVVQGSKTMHITSGALHDGLFNSTTKLSFGIQVGAGGVPSENYYFSGEAKDWIIRSNNGATVQMNIPNLKVGTDTSGNGFDGVYQ